MKADLTLDMDGYARLGYEERDQLHDWLRAENLFAVTRLTVNGEGTVEIERVHLDEHGDFVIVDDAIAHVVETVTVRTPPPLPVFLRGQTRPT